MVTVSIKIDDKEKKRLEAYAKKADLSVSQVIRRAIREYLMNAG